MPVNRNALIRYRTIDKCLRNRFRKWTLDDLIYEVSETLYDYEGIEKGVSKRTVQMDIQMMRSDKLGYNAPIVVTDKKYYTYEDPEYSITNIPLTDQDLDKLGETVGFLKQFKGFSHFRELDGMVQKLEDHVYSRKSRQKPVIDFEKNEQLKGLEFLDTLYRAIIRKETLELTYQSFKARNEATFRFYPYLLKEFKNRWFIIGVRKRQMGFINLALDRIIAVSLPGENFEPSQRFDPETYFKDVIGVSVSPELPPQEVILHLSREHAPYILTKPLHASQKVLSRNYTGTTISIKVQLNFELEKEILGFGEGIRVIGPPALKRRIRKRLGQVTEMYDTDLSTETLRTAVNRLFHRGTSIINKIYTRKELSMLAKLLGEELSQKKGQRNSVDLVAEHSRWQDLSELLINENLQKIIASISKNAFLTGLRYIDRNAISADDRLPMQFYQTASISVVKKTETEGFNNWVEHVDHFTVEPPDQVLKSCLMLRIHLDPNTANNGAMQVIPGSHLRRLSDGEIQTIAQNSLPLTREVAAGGVHLMSPLLIRAVTKNINSKSQRVIEIDIATKELPNGLKWSLNKKID